MHRAIRNEKQLSYVIMLHIVVNTKSTKICLYLFLFSVLHKVCHGDDAVGKLNPSFTIP